MPGAERAKDRDLKSHRVLGTWELCYFLTSQPYGTLDLASSLLLKDTSSSESTDTDQHHLSEDIRLVMTTPSEMARRDLDVVHYLRETIPFLTCVSEEVLNDLPKSEPRARWPSYSARWRQRPVVLRSK